MKKLLGLFLTILLLTSCTTTTSLYSWGNYEEAIISGGATQGLAQGDLFIVKKKGKIVTNPQTGIKFELPGKEVAKVSIEMTGGDTPETEFSIVNFKEGSIDKNNLADYYIEEIKQ